MNLFELCAILGALAGAIGPAVALAPHGPWMILGGVVGGAAGGFLAGHLLALVPLGAAALVHGPRRRGKRQGLGGASK